eukprot:PITA_02813
MHAPPSLFHPVITVGPFTKWGIDFMTCNPRSAGGHGYIIVSVDYFIKWARAMLTLCNDVKDATGFTLFQLVYGLEATLSIECEIPSLKLAVKLLPNTTLVEERLLYLERADKTHRLSSLVIKAQKKRVKTHFDQTVTPISFIEGDLVLLYNQVNDKLGAGKFEPMWQRPYLVKRILQKGAYELIDYEGNPLDKPRNGLYLKKYYA